MGSRKDHDGATIFSSNQKDEIVEVLYQKMGNRWYSFFVIDEDVYMGEVPEEAIHEMRHRELKDVSR